MTATTESVPLFERFTVTYPSGTVIPPFYAGGAYLEEVRFTHPPGDRRGPQRTGLSVAAWEVQPMGQIGKRKPRYNHAMQGPRGPAVR